MLKSMIMLCAAGVRPVDSNGIPLQDVELVPIIIDPHKSNADLKRTEKLLSAYSAIRDRHLGVPVCDLKIGYFRKVSCRGSFGSFFPAFLVI